jgi:hypothetical protein
VAVKNEYDPSNLFRDNQNIKPTVYRATVGAAAAAKYATISFWWHLLDSIPSHSELSKTRGCHRNSQRPTLNDAKFRGGTQSGQFLWPQSGQFLESAKRTQSEARCSWEFDPKRPNREFAASCTINLR